MVAADQLDFSGTSGGVIYGPIIGLKDLPVKVDGNIELLIDRSATSRAGIKKVFGFEPVSGTYSELIGQQTPPIPGGFPDPGLQPNPEGPIDPHK